MFCNARKRLFRFHPRTPVRGATTVEEVAAYCRENFNPRTPVRGATKTRAPQSWCYVISIHAPLCGVRPSGRPKKPPELRISIHAPLCGVRHCTFSTVVSIRQFQSTHPCAGCDLARRGLLVCRGISIHAPLCGVRQHRRHTTLAKNIFQSTHPCAGCDDVCPYGLS